MSLDDFRRLLARFGSMREVLGEAEAEDRIATANKRRQEASELEGQLIAEFSRLVAEVNDRDKLLRRAFESGDDAFSVISADASWDRWAR